MKCEYCDNEVSMGLTHCPYCGAVVLQQSSNFVKQHSGAMRSNEIVSTNSAPLQSIFRKPTQMTVLKSKLKFVFLGIFLGVLGIHNFYLGYIGRGIVKLLITLLSFGLLSWVSWIWGIVEICTVRIDAKGFPLE